MSRPVLTWSLLILIAGTSVAQKTTIICSAKGAEGKSVRLVKAEDFISLRKADIASARIDSAGNFQMTVSLKEITYAWFCIDYYTGDVYLQPNTTHHYNLDGLKFNNETDKLNTNLAPLSVNVQVLDTGDRLNLYIQQCNVSCNRFLIDHLKDIRTSKFKKLLASFKASMDSAYHNVGNDYVSVYVNYRLASLERMNSTTSSEKLFKEYILDKPVLTGHVEYMDFLSEFFEDYFEEVNRPVGLSQLRRAINEYQSWKALDEAISADSLLRNEYLLETVMLITLRNLYGLNTFSKDNIIKILKQSASTGKFEQHRLIASNLVRVLTMYEAGSKAPGFNLPDAAGDTMRLHELTGKFVYLNFFTTWNISCLEELELMRSLYSKYGQSVQFVSICCDREYMKMYHFARDKKYPWPLLHYNGDYKFLEAYGVKTYPYFVLIDKQGNFIADPAESPSQNIEMKLNEVIKKAGNQ
jgi:peroxiredoxin